MANKKRHLLLLLDLNGVLFCRPSSKKSNFFSSSLISANPGALEVRSTLVLRPHFSEFMAFCFENFHVGIWTSLSSKNAYPLIGRILGTNVTIFHRDLISDYGYPVDLPFLPQIASLAELERISLHRLVQRPEDRETTVPFLQAQIAVKRHQFLAEDSSLKGELALLFTQGQCTVIKDSTPFKIRSHRPLMFKNLSILWDTADIGQCKSTKHYNQCKPTQYVDKYPGKKEKDNHTMHDSHLSRHNSGPHDEPSNDRIMMLSEILSKITINGKNDSYSLSRKPLRDISQISIEAPNKTCFKSDWNASNVLLIDDSAYKFSMTPYNGIAIPKFSEDSKNDTHLLDLMKYLKACVIPLLDSPDFDIKNILKFNPFPPNIGT